MNSEAPRVPTSPQISANFLADLDVVCPNDNTGSFPSTFVSDLDSVYAHALTLTPQEPSVADLDSLAGDLKAWRSYTQRQLQAYLARLPSDDPLLNPVSLFGTMDYGRLETAHTRTLAWLLDKEEHGFGFQLLEALLLHLPESGAIRLTRVGRVESELPVRCGPSRKSAGRIDVLAEGTWDESGNEVSWLLVIEAKIDAGESEEQLSLYEDWIEDRPQDCKLRVFLTPEGRKPQTALTEWYTLSFPDLAGVFRRVSTGLKCKLGYHFLRYYLTGLLRDVCGLPVPISANCSNPYAAVEYLKSVFAPSESEDGHERPYGIKLRCDSRNGSV